MGKTVITHTPAGIVHFLNFRSSVGDIRGRRIAATLAIRNASLMQPDYSVCLLALYLMLCV
jgi:hypothetical protein